MTQSSIRYRHDDEFRPEHSQKLLRRQEEGVVVSSLHAVAHDLADIVDGVGVDERPTGAGGDEGVEIFHAAA